MATDLELLLIPRGVPVGRALNRAELDLEGSLGRAHPHREGGLEKHLPLLPMDAGDEVDAGNPVIYGDVLLEAAIAVPADHAHDRAHRPRLHDVDFRARIPGVLPPVEGRVDIPGGLALGAILEEL